ncbi:MAG: polyprenyl synthetase family protein [Planctomycetota bacterium]
MLMPTDTDAPIRQRLADELTRVESRFRAELMSDLECVNTLVDHVERFRGKMLRPTLVLACGLAAGESASDAMAVGAEEKLRVVSTVVEMVHMATLVHDDILDEADVRRRGHTVNALTGNETAVMLGDYLISHAYHLCSSLDDQAISRQVAATTNVVCEGELLQLSNRHHWELDEPTYFDIIRRKTASLCGLCCRLGAELGGADAATIEAYEGYGERLGVAFQVIDDVLDLTGDEAVVGKSLGLDAQKHKLTLPLIHHLATGDGEQRTATLSLLRDRPEGAPPPRGLLRRAIESTGSIAYARSQAQGLVDQAKARVAAVSGDGPAAQLLIGLANAVTARDR